MTLEELRRQLAECGDPNGTQTALVAECAPKHADSKTRKPECQPWEQIGATVLLSDDPHPEALNLARNKCECGHARDVCSHRDGEAGFWVHVILPCCMCLR